MQEYKLNKDQFVTFVNLLNKLTAKYHTDITIKDGLIRQSGDEVSVTYNIDISKIVAPFSLLYIAKVKDKMASFIPLVNQQVSDVSIFIDDNVWILKDSVSEYTNKMGLKKFMTTKFLGDEEYKTKINLGEQIFSYDLKKFIIDRITYYNTSISGNKLYLKFKDGKCMLKAATSNNSQSVNFVSIDYDYDLAGIGAVCDQTFRLTQSDMILTLYRRGGDILDDYYLHQEFKVEDVPINTYTLFQIINKGEKNKDKDKEESTKEEEF